MRYSHSSIQATIFLGLALTFSGCKSNNQVPAPGEQPAAAAPGTAPDGSVPASGQPAPGSGSAQAPAPVVTSITVPDGTTVSVRTTQTLSAKNSSVGQGWSGVLNRAVVVDEATVFPRGTPVTGTVVASKGQGHFKGAGALGIDLTHIGDYRVSSTEYEVAVKGKGKRTAGFIAGGAGGGALLGGLFGGGKGAAIGALAGAGAGTAGAAYTGNKDVVIPSESAINFTLTQPVTVRR